MAPFTCTDTSSGKSKLKFWVQSFIAAGYSLENNRGNFNLNVRRKTFSYHEQEINKERFLLILMSLQKIAT